MSLKSFFKSTWLSTLISALLMAVGSFIAILSAFSSFSEASGFESFGNGVALVANRFLMFLTEKTGQMHVLFDATMNADYIFGVVVICELCAFACVWAVLRASLLPAMFPAVLFVVGYTTGFFESGVGLLLFVLGLLLLLVTFNSGKEQNVRSFLFTLLSLALVTGIVSAVVFPSVSTIHAERNTQAIHRFLHKIRYDRGTGDLPHGDTLFKIDSDGEKPLLKVQMDKPSRLYLRAFAAENFDGRRWTPTDNKVLATYSDLFYYLHSNGFYIEEQIPLALKSAQIEEQSGVTIKNVNACKAPAFLPSSAEASEVIEADKIGSNIGKGTGSSYIAMMSPNDLPTIFAAQRAMARNETKRTAQYLEYERAYARFVKETAMDVSPEVTEVFKRLIAGDPEKQALADKISFVLRYLEHFELTDVPEPTAGKNSAVWLMEQCSTATQAQLASVATLMLRYLGVPARYVEGYYLPPEQASEIAPGETVAITATHTHVWAEYYLDGIGWIPLETIPGFSREEKTFYEETEAETDEENEEPLQEAPQENPDDGQSNGKQDSREISAFVIVLYALGVILLLLLLWILFLRLRLRKRLSDIRRKENNEKVPDLFAYAEYVREQCDVSVNRQAQEQAKQLSDQALFSSHSINDEHVQSIEDYLSHTVECSNTQKTFWQKLKIRFWDAIY